MSLLLLLFLTGHVFAKEPPDVDCFVMHLQYVYCSWNKQGTPEVNYTFSSRFHHQKEFNNCTTYVSENGTATGCQQPYEDLSDRRFHIFYTRLVDGNKTFSQKQKIAGKVRFFPPVNLTVQKNSDSKLVFYWNQTASELVESEVRYRFNNNWETSSVSLEVQNFTINSPSNNSRYELQVRSTLGEDFGGLFLWSDWSESVFWEPRNSKAKPTEDTRKIHPAFVWIPVLLGVITLFTLVILLLYCERIRVTLNPGLPQPSFIHSTVESWFQTSKGWNCENFKANYTERVCSVSEYTQVPQSDTKGSDGSTCSVTSFQMDCPGSELVNGPEDPTEPCSSSSSTTGIISSEQEKPMLD